jgi:hypothetical protein
VGILSGDTCHFAGVSLLFSHAASSNEIVIILARILAPGPDFESKTERSAYESFEDIGVVGRSFFSRAGDGPRRRG